MKVSANLKYRPCLIYVSNVYLITNWASNRNLFQNEESVSHCRVIRVIVFLPEKLFVLDQNNRVSMAISSIHVCPKIAIRIK